MDTRKKRIAAAETISDQTLGALGAIGTALNDDNQSEAMYFRRFVQIIGIASTGFVGLGTLFLVQFIANSEKD